MTLQLVNHVVRQQRLGERGEPADVGEEDRHLHLVADRVPRSGTAVGSPPNAHCIDASTPATEVRADVRERDVVIVEKQPPDGDVARDPRLAGEAEVRVEAERLQRSPASSGSARSTPANPPRRPPGRWSTRRALRRRGRTGSGHEATPAGSPPRGDTPRAADQEARTRSASHAWARAYVRRCGHPSPVGRRWCRCPRSDQSWRIVRASRRNRSASARTSISTIRPLLIVKPVTAYGLLVEGCDGARGAVDERRPHLQG